MPDPGVKKAPDPGSGSATLLQCRISDPHWFNADPEFFLIPDPEPKFWWPKSKNWENFSAKTKLYFLDKTQQFTYHQASIKYAQATGEGFRPQKRTSSTSKHDFLYFFIFLWVIFALLDSDPDPAICGSANPTSMYCIYNKDDNNGCTSPKCQQSVCSSFLQYSTERSCQIRNPATLQTSVADPDP